MTFSKDLQEFLANPNHYYVVTLGMASFLLAAHEAKKARRLKELGQ